MKNDHESSIYSSLWLILATLIFIHLPAVSWAGESDVGCEGFLSTEISYVREFVAFNGGKRKLEIAKKDFDSAPDFSDQFWPLETGDMFEVQYRDGTSAKVVARVEFFTNTQALGSGAETTDRVYFPVSVFGATQEVLLSEQMLLQIAKVTYLGQVPRKLLRRQSAYFVE